MMRRLLVEEIVGDRVTLVGEQHHRATRVLRLGRGDRLRVFDGEGREYEAVIEAADRQQALLRLERLLPPLPEPSVRVTLLQSIPRGDGMERVVQKGVEIGVAEIVPLVSARTVVRMRAGGTKLARWRKIALHAVEQSGRSRLVPVAKPMTVQEIVPHVAGADLVLVPHHGAGQALRQALRIVGRPRSAMIVVGPEGGLGPHEIELLAGAGARVVSLGPRVLRSETAGVITAGLILYHFGDMG